MQMTRCSSNASCSRSNVASSMFAMSTPVISAPSAPACRVTCMTTTTPSERSGEAIHGHLDHGGTVVGESFAQRGADVGSLGDTRGVGTEALGELHEVGVAQRS